MGATSRALPKEENMGLFHSHNVLSECVFAGCWYLGHIGSSQPPMHLRKPFQPFKDVGTSLPSLEKALSFNSATTVTSAAGYY